MSYLNNCTPERLKSVAVKASISTAILLIIIKAVAAYLTGSLAILSSMADSFADAVSSVITFIAVHYSSRPLNDKHRYGYGKLESLSALLQAAFIAGSAGFIAYDGIYRFIHPVSLKTTSAGILIMLISLVLTLALIMFQNYVNRKVHSLAVAADSAHYKVDIISNLGVICSLIIIHFLNWQWFDILVALIIAVYLLKNAWDIAVEALGEITDCEVDEKTKQHILQQVLSQKGVKGCHDFRSRLSGNYFFIELHLELDGNLTLFEAHEITEKTEKKIMQSYPHAQIIIHQDPYGIREKRLDHQISGQCDL